MDCLRHVEHQVESRGLHAAGLVSYEAAPAFDRALTVRAAPGFPLLWFGLFEAVETIVPFAACKQAAPCAVATTHDPQAGAPGAPSELNDPSSLSLISHPSSFISHLSPAVAATRVVAADRRPASGCPWYPAGLNDWQPSVTAEEYAAVIGRLRDAIAAGETYQVNYTFRLRQPAASDPWGLFEDLVAAQQPPYAAYVETPDFALCSASPELFFELEGRADRLAPHERHDRPRPLVRRRPGPRPRAWPPRRRTGRKTP